MVLFSEAETISFVVFTLPHVRMAQLGELQLMIEARRLYSPGVDLTCTQLIVSAIRPRFCGRSPELSAFKLH